MNLRLSLLWSVLLGPLCAWAVLSPTAVSATPLPEFLGVYAVANGKLVELTPLGGERFTIGTLGNVAFESPVFTEFSAGKIELIAYLQDEPRFSPKIQRLARVVAREEIDISDRITNRKKLTDSWYPSDKNEVLKFAPIPSNPQMMLRAVPGKALESGLWLFSVGTHYYVLGIGSNPKRGADCLVQRVRLGTLFEYRKCGPGELAQSTGENLREFIPARIGRVKGEFAQPRALHSDGLRHR